MVNAKPLAAILRTAAAALIAAAAVASCSSDRPVESVPAAASSTSATSGDKAAGSTSTVSGDEAASPSTAASTASAPTVAADTTIASETTTSASESLIAVAAPATTASVTGVTTPFWDYSPLTDHLSYDSVNDARMQAPNPATIRIPRLDVEAPIIPLGLEEDGSIEVPENPDQAGWWLGGPEPGELGPAVILGHVDSQEEGPAVFFHLRYMEAGDKIHIDRVDGSTITYVVDSTERHDKDEFPTEAVYGPTEQPTLRLVTCGGDFDFDVRTYEENVIVFASLA